MKRSRFTNLFSLFVACTLIALPATLGCGDGDTDLDGDVATEEMGDDYDPEMDADAGVAESDDSEPADSEPADSEPADSEPADSEPADSEPADSEPADDESVEDDSEEN